MTVLFKIGMCIIINSTAYTVVAVDQETYLLEQVVIAFEERRHLVEYWKIQYVDKHSKIAASKSLCE